jgi:hypothetical protein
MFKRAAALVAGLFLLSAAHAEEKRLALVLSNQDYPAAIGRLSQSHADAKTVEKALKDVGFKVTRKEDQNTVETQTVIGDFLRAIDAEAADGDQVVVFFYAAMHGVAGETIEGTRNFLIPAKENIDSSFALLNRGIRVDAIINGLAASKAKAVIVVSDACRNTATAFTRGDVRGFVPVSAGSNMMIAYATEAGATTPDDGVFAKVLAGEIEKSGRKANYAMADVVGNVGRERSVNSRPYTTGSLPDWFCFNGCDVSAPNIRYPISATTTLLGHASYVTSAAFSPDGSRVFTASGDQTVRAWNAKTGALLTTLAGHEGTVTALAVSPDGRRLVSGSPDGTARVWDPLTGRVLATIQGHTDSVLSVAFSADGARIVTGSADRTAKIWDVETTKQIATLKSAAADVVNVSYTPEGSVVTAGSDNNLRIWDGRTGAPLATIPSLGALAGLLAMSPDGRNIVQLSDDNTARVWSTSRGETVATLVGHSDRILHAAFSPDGRQIVTVSADKTTKIWTLP